MSSNEIPKKLSPVSDRHSFVRSPDYLPPAPFGIPWLARLRNESQERTVASYTALEKAINAHLSALTEQVGLKTGLMEAHARATGRANKIDAVREIAELQIDEELDGYRHRAQIRAKTSDLELLRLERELKQERKALDDLDRVSGASAAPATAADDLARILNEVREMDGAFADHIAQIVADAGGDETSLSEEARRHIDHVRMLQATKVAELYEKLI